MTKRRADVVLPSWQPSPLNLATSAAYAACGDSHRLGDRWLIREVNAVDHVMLICEDCGVPIVAAYASGSLRIKPVAA